MKIKIVLTVSAILLCITGIILSETKMLIVFQPQNQNDAPVYILDAGHGGEDGGAVSQSGISESKINLELTLKLDSILCFLGCPTMLTRNEDRSLHNESAMTLREKKVSDLKKRVSIVQSYPEATLISIHQNSYPEEKYHGTQVFYAPTKDSQYLAQQIQKRVADALQQNNSRQAKQIPDSVYLMNHIENRAILVECGFLTNRKEEALLQEAEYQKKLALVLAVGLFSEA